MLPGADRVLQEHLSAAVSRTTRTGVQVAQQALRAPARRSDIRVAAASACSLFPGAPLARTPRLPLGANSQTDLHGEAKTNSRAEVWLYSVLFISSSPVYYLMVISSCQIASMIPLSH
jgi:hypothetical protein